MKQQKHQKQQKQLEALICDLERELSEDKSQVAVLEQTSERLRETERICHELADENRQLGKEIAGWQERFAASEENQRKVSELRQQLDALRVEHARFTDGERQTAETPTQRSDGGRASLAPHGQALGGRDPAAKIQPANRTEGSPIAWDWLVQNWRSGAAFGCIVIFALAAAVSVMNLRADAPPSGEPISAPEATAVEAVAGPLSNPSVKPPRVPGAFQTIRPTQVFSGPSEDSALIANIGKGIKVNVVDASDGWLEIRSKHGRPPGFIRQESAVRIALN